MQYNTAKKKERNYSSLTAPSPHCATVSKNMYKLNNNEAVFDSYAQGFDLPASV